ncbi:A disintegrin and metalloproteinase with thrombospondin motifs 17 [Liparis tanakae]|uniref:A disintegrin and metalloproteinase with thrombospondin motifs 17 n=1 Tax=Liparis tanakae TaxID=230148 RepID=A0A4Z2IDX8_9TELE|nr:A disintegrin and metalloproteinase with thrombospondin motifs 17 [Liparis tanakae]
MSLKPVSDLRGPKAQTRSTAFLHFLPCSRLSSWVLSPMMASRVLGLMSRLFPSLRDMFICSRVRISSALLSNRVVTSDRKKHGKSSFTMSTFGGRITVSLNGMMGLEALISILANLQKDMPGPGGRHRQKANVEHKACEYLPCPKGSTSFRDLQCLSYNRHASKKKGSLLTAIINDGSQVLSPRCGPAAQPAELPGGHLTLDT